ncbi:MAG: hypothetical protein L0Y71_10340 [Gemmataceae bacterium]|nr:hypothetical protein [Gemmataceae bacterium]
MRPLLACLALFAFVALGALGQSAQPQTKDPKDAAKQPAKDMKKANGKMSAKEAKGNDTTSRPRPTLDKLKLPADAIVILIEKVQDVAEFIPEAVYLSLERYEELRSRIQALEQQLKADKATTHSCRLTGKLDGDYVALKAEFTFSTQQPNARVVLGLQGAHLVDEGDLDKAVAQLDYGDDGFVVRVPKEGTHQLKLNLKAPVAVKKTLGLTGPERGLDLGLPGALVTTLSLELPPAVKNLRVNDAVKTTRSPGRWDMPLGAAKQVNIAWKEPQAVASGRPLLVLDVQATVKLEETFAQIHADLVVEDWRGQTKEWRLLLPPGAAPTVKSLPAGSYQWTPPDAKNPWHVLQLKDATSERITIALQTSVQRPTPRMAVGPFAAAGAFRQQGSVLVQAAPDALRGQRLVFHRQGEVTQRELPAAQPGLENLALFHYVVTPAPGSTATKAPVELEFKASGGLAETQTDHTVRLKGDADVWYVETTTRIQAKSLAEITDFLDVQLPRQRVTGLEGLLGMPGVAFPASLPWASMVPRRGRLDWAAPVEFRWEEDGSELTQPDGARRARLRWSRQNAKQFTLTIHGKYAAPAGADRLRVELPRPLGILDRGGSLSVHSGPLVELLNGPNGGEEPVPERHHWFRQLEAAPAAVDVAWRPFQPPLAVAAVANVVVHERSAQVRQHLSFVVTSAKGAASGNLRFRVPAELKRVQVVSGGKLLGEPIPEEGALWITPFADVVGKCELVLEFDAPVPAADEADKPGPRVWTVPLVWPEGTTRHDAKVRVWCAPGAFPALAPGAADWHERGIELVPGRDSLPALVVQGVGTRVPLTMQLRPASQGALAPLLCDRTLMQVHVDDSGNQFYRARFLVRKLAARQLTVELPVPVRGRDSGLLAVRFGADKQEKVLPWNDPVWNVAAIDLPHDLPSLHNQPVFLELEYKLLASQIEGKYLGRTLLHPPKWHGEVLPGTVRWQVDLPADHVAVVAGTGAVLDYRWALQGWLLAPEASVTSGDLEAWLTGREDGEATPVGMSYWRPGLTVQRLFHLPRPWWLLACSGLVLAVGLAMYLVPLGRALLWLLGAALCVGVVGAALLWPALLPAVLYGAEPGLAVLTVLLGLQWFMQERYRRQIVVMPGFARLPTGSSVTRPGPARPREPSTIDAPAPSVASSSSSAK